MKAINDACFKLKEKATKCVKKISLRNFINFTGNKCPMSIRCGKLAI